MTPAQASNHVTRAAGDPPLWHILLPVLVLAGILNQLIFWLVERFGP